MLAYTWVYSFYSQDTESMDVVEQQTENLELHTNALQILLGELAHRCPCANIPCPSRQLSMALPPITFPFLPSFCVASLSRV